MTIKSWANKISKLTKDEVSLLNSSFNTRQMRMVDNRTGIAPETPIDPDSFCKNIALSNDVMTLYDNISVAYLFWTSKDWEELDECLRVHDIHLERQEVIYKWHKLCGGKDIATSSIV